MEKLENKKVQDFYFFLHLSNNQQSGGERFHLFSTLLLMAATGCRNLNFSGVSSSEMKPWMECVDTEANLLYVSAPSPLLAQCHVTFGAGSGNNLCGIEPFNLLALELSDSVLPPFAASEMA